MVGKTVEIANEENAVDMHRHEDTSTREAPLTNDDSLRIILSRPGDPQACSFWVGLYKSRGTGTSKDFLQIDKLDNAFKYLSDMGLAEDQPLMHSDNTGTAHRQFFLLPQSEFARDPKAGKSLILKTLGDLVQKKVGLYMAPGLLKLPETKQLLGELLVGLSQLKTEEVYLLTTDIGVNQLLNVSLAVKEHLRDTRGVWIFH